MEYGVSEAADREGGDDMATVIKDWGTDGCHPGGYFVVAQGEAGIADFFELSIELRSGSSAQTKFRALAQERSIFLPGWGSVESQQCARGGTDM